MKSKSFRRIAATVAMTAGILTAAPLIGASSAQAAPQPSVVTDLVAWIIGFLGDPGCC